MLGSYLNNQGRDMSKDFEDDDLGIDDNEFGEFDDDFGDFGSEPMSEPPKNGREAVLQSVSKTGSSFIDEFKDDKLESATEIAKNAIPDKLSNEASLAVNINDTVKDEVSGALNQVRKEANNTFKLVKRIVPENNERINSVVDKIGSVFGLDDSNDSSGSVSKEKIQLEAITSEINTALGEKSERDKKEQLLRDQIEANRNKSQLELAATTAANLNSMRAFNNDIANVYYRKNLEVNLKSLYVQKDQLELIKSGFDTFKNQFESIVRNTALPDIIKTRSSEVAVNKIKMKAMESVGDALLKASPLGAFKKNFGAKVADARDSILSALSGANSGMEMLAGDDIGLSKEQLLASFAGTYAKEKAGKFLGRQIEKTDTGRDFISKIKTKGTDIEAILKNYASNTDSEMSSNLLMGLSELFSTRRRDKYTLQKQDLNDVTLFDKRVHSSIVKVIPGLLSKIYGEVKSLRTGDNKPKDNELYYDHDSSRFLSAKQQSRKIEVAYKRKVERTVGVSAVGVINAIAAHGNLAIGKTERDILTQALVEYLVIKKGTRNIESLKDNKFTSLLPESFKKPFKEAIRTIIKNSKSSKPDIRESSINAIDTINTGMTSLAAYGTSIDMQKEMTELDAMGYGNIANKFNITSKDSITGEHRLNTGKLDKRLLETAGKLNTAKIDRVEAATKADEEKAKAEAKEAEKNSLKGRLKKKYKGVKLYTGGYVPGYASGGVVKAKKSLQERLDSKRQSRNSLVRASEAVENIRASRYTGDGGKYTVAGVVHKGEYVLSKDKLKSLLNDIRNGDSEAIKDQLSKISKDVNKYTKDLSTKLQSSNAFKYLDNNTKDLQKKLSSSYELVSEQTLKLSKTISTGLQSTLSNSEKLFQNSFTSAKKYMNNLIESETGVKVKNFVNTTAKNVKESKYYKSTLSVAASGILAGFNDDEVKSLKKIWKKLYKDKPWNDFIVNDSIRLLGSHKVKNTYNKTKQGIHKLSKMSKDDIVTNIKDTATDTVDNVMNSELVKNAKETKYYKSTLSTAASTILAGFNNDEVKSLKKIWKRLYSDKPWDEFIITDSIRLLGSSKIRNNFKSAKQGIHKLSKMSKDELVKNVKGGVSDTVDKVANSKVIKNTSKKAKSLYKTNYENKIDSEIGYYGDNSTLDNIMSKDEIRTHRKIWKKLHNDKSWEDYLKQASSKYRTAVSSDIIGTFKGDKVEKYTSPLEKGKIAADKKTRYLLSKTRDGKRNVNERVKSFGENFTDIKNAFTDSLFKNDDDIDYTSKYEDYSDDDKNALKSEFFASEEYQSGNITNYYKWLRVSKLIDTGDKNKQLTGIMSSIRKKSKYLTNVKTKLGKAKDELVNELVGKITGTGTKELSLDQEAKMREEFFNTKEYKEGTVTNFDEWLDSFGYKRNGAGILSRLKKAFTAKNFFSKTRKLDKWIAGKAFGLAGKGLLAAPVLGAKGIGLGAKLGWNTGKFVGKYAGGGVLSAANSGIRGLTGLSLSPDDMPVNKARLKDSLHGEGLFNNGLVGKTVKGIAGLASGMVKPFDKDVMENARKVTKEENGALEFLVGEKLEEKKEKKKLDKLNKRKEAKRKKLEKLKLRKAKYDKNGDGVRDGSWLSRLGAFGRKKKDTELKKKIGGKEDNKLSLLGLVGKYLPMLATGIFGLGNTIVSGVTGALSGLAGMLIKGITGAFGGLKSMLGFGKHVPEVNVESGVKPKAGETKVKKGSSFSKTSGKIKNKKGLLSKLKTFVSSIKGKIFKKFGMKAGGRLVAKLVAKIGGLFTPIFGQAMMAYTLVTITSYLVRGKSFISAALLAILGVDLFADDAVVKDDNGELIKPDDPKISDGKKKDYDKQSKDITGVTKTNVKTHNINRANRISFNKDKSLKDTLYKQENGDGFNKHTKIKNSVTKPAKVSVMAKGGITDPSGGFNNLIIPKGVRVDGFKPALAENLSSMANEYYNITGNKIPINSGYRSYEDQLALKKKYGNKAASPGKSTHEFGLAFDTNTTTAEELDKLGLMKKYGFTRPVGKETWHVESAGIQLDINGAKQDPEYANNMIADSIGAGGSGWGTVNKARKYSRNKLYQEKLINLREELSKPTDKPANNIKSPDNKNKVGVNKLNYTVNNIADKPVKSKNKLSIKTQFTDSVDSENNKSTVSKNSTTRQVKQSNLTTDKNTMRMLNKYQKEVVANTAKIAESTSAGLEVQKQMLDILGTISGNLDSGLDIKNLDSIPQPNIVLPSSDKQPVNKTTYKDLPKPTVDIRRKKYTT